MKYDDLKDIRSQRQRVKSLQERIDRLRSGAEYPLRMLGEICGKGETSDKLAEDIAKIIDLERELAFEILTLESRTDDIERELMKLPENQERVLRLRYCEGLPWKRVAREAGYCMSHCKNLNTKFIKEQTQVDVFV